MPRSLTCYSSTPSHTASIYYEPQRRAGLRLSFQGALAGVCRALLIADGSLRSPWGRHLLELLEAMGQRCHLRRWQSITAPRHPAPRALDLLTCLQAAWSSGPGSLALVPNSGISSQPSSGCQRTHKKLYDWSPPGHGACGSRVSKIRSPST